MSRSFNPSAGYFLEEPPRPFPWVNVVLFLATCLSTLLVGFLSMKSFEGIGFWDALENLWLHPTSIVVGLPFSAAIMSILFAHEMGHYLTCVYYGIDATLPYFIPFPNHVGTMGAFIKIRSRFEDRGSLLEVGVAGPIAGFIVAVHVLVISMLYTPRFIVPQTMEEGLVLGEPLIYKIVQHIMGAVPPPGMDTYMHPLTFAAWFGFLATALNLLPAAQLDGGHITYAFFRGFHKWVSWVVVATLIPLAFYYWVGWYVWIGLLLALKLKHPPTADDSIPLQPRQVVLGLIGLALLVLCFMPAPFIF